MIDQYFLYAVHKHKSREIIDFVISNGPNLVKITNNLQTKHGSLLIITTCMCSSCWGGE